MSGRNGKCRFEGVGFGHPPQFCSYEKTTISTCRNHYSTGGGGWGEMEIEMGSRALAEKSRPPKVGHLFGRSAARHPPDRPAADVPRAVSAEKMPPLPPTPLPKPLPRPRRRRHSRRPSPRPPPPPPRWKWRMRSLALSSTRSACGARARWEKPQDLRGSQST